MPFPSRANRARGRSWDDLSRKRNPPAVVPGRTHSAIGQAFGQVADALSALQHDDEAVSTSQNAVEIAGASLGLQRISVAAGKTSVLQLITAENTYSSARLALARAQGQQLTDTAQLFIAVGGGWWNGVELGDARR